MKEIQTAMFVPAHAAATENITELAQYNVDKVWEIAEKILSLCKEPMIFENILQALFHAYGLQMNFEQYVLVGSTVRSYLAWLKDAGKMEAFLRKSSYAGGRCKNPVKSRFFQEQ